jgi:hypothetical protein
LQETAATLAGKSLRACLAGSRPEQLRRQHRGPRPRSRDVDLTGLFRGHRLTAGSRITVTVTQRNTNGKAFVFAIRKGKLPKPQVGCLAPGSSKLNRAC